MATFDITPPVIEIPLTQGQVAIVDADDYPLISQHKWHAQRCLHKYYALTNINLDNGSRTQISMHRMIMDAPKGLEVDHIDRNGLNNRRSNLRLATHAQNTRNQGKWKETASKYKGLSLDKRDMKWQVKVFYNGKYVTVGRFFDEEEAARAYDAKARELFGEFAHCNFK